MEYTDEENEMLAIYGRARLDGLSRVQSTTFLFKLGYTPTHKVLEAIRTQDKSCFWFLSKYLKTSKFMKLSPKDKAKVFEVLPEISLDKL